MGKTLIGIGVWLLSDALISIRLYPQQSWLKDHSIRIIRGLLGIAVIGIGAIIE